MKAFKAQKSKAASLKSHSLKSNQCWGMDMNNELKVAQASTGRSCSCQAMKINGMKLPGCRCSHFAGEVTAINSGPLHTCPLCSLKWEESGQRLPSLPWQLLHET